MIEGQMMKRLSGLIAVASLGTAIAAGVPAASASESGLSPLAAANATTYPGESYSQYRRYGGRGYYGRRRGYGGAIGAGVAGLAAGALIGGAIASSQAQAAYPAYGAYGAPVGNVYGQDPNAVEYCASRYRSYDPASGTFLANDGNRYSCP
jgi:hypothetical protein